MKDTLGRVLKKGDDVVYGTRIGSSMYFLQAKVIVVEDDRVKVLREEYERVAEVWLREPHYIVLLKSL